MIEADDEVSNEVGLQHFASMRARAREFFSSFFCKKYVLGRGNNCCIAAETEKKIKEIMIIAKSFKIPFVSCCNTFKVTRSPSNF